VDPPYLGLVYRKRPGHNHTELLFVRDTEGESVLPVYASETLDLAIESCAGVPQLAFVVGLAESAGVFNFKPAVVAVALERRTNIASMETAGGVPVKVSVVRSSGEDGQVFEASEIVEAGHKGCG
jgi:hypothetical protein